MAAGPSIVVFALENSRSSGDSIAPERRLDLGLLDVHAYVFSGSLYGFFSSFGRLASFENLFWPGASAWRGQRRTFSIAPIGSRD